MDFQILNLSHLQKNGDTVQTVQIEKGIYKNIDVKFSEDVGVLVSKGSNSNINKTIELPSSISAPINKGDIIGGAKFTLNDEVISTVPLISETSVNKISIFTMSTKILNSWFNLCKK